MVEIIKFPPRFSGEIHTHKFRGERRGKTVIVTIGKVGAEKITSLEALRQIEPKSEFSDLPWNVPVDADEIRKIEQLGRKAQVIFDREMELRAAQTSPRTTRSRPR